MEKYRHLSFVYADHRCSNVVIVSLFVMTAGWVIQQPPARGGLESVGRLRKPLAWNLPLTFTPGRRFSRFQAAPFPPAKIATAHWAARDHPHFDLVHASTTNFAHRRNTTTNFEPPIRYAWPRSVYQLALTHLLLPLSFSPCTNCNHITNNVESPLGRLVNITLTHLVAL